MKPLKIKVSITLDEEIINEIKDSKFCESKRGGYYT